ncbi:MAG: hypothetical protein WCG74_11475 [Sediminibacterium sp.]
MKKILIIFCFSWLISGCFIFRRSNASGCPSNGRNIGAEKIAAGDTKAIKASRRAKYLGGQSSY